MSTADRNRRQIEEALERFARGAETQEDLKDFTSPFIMQHASGEQATTFQILCDQRYYFTPLAVIRSWHRVLRLRYQADAEKWRTESCPDKVD